ncbi:MAG: thioredoxin-dependent thiol peroxidase [Bacteroidia bacterium]|nr:thioredoxin-dependent thiol peroxidase [Bacteroidia bacterium]
MSTLSIGKKAPLFTGTDHNGDTITLKSFLSKKVILYFYPKDNTPACTAQACNLRDHYQKFKKSGYEIIGISTDSVKKHQNFIAKYQLPFILVSDPDYTICEQYGVWAEKKLYGRTYMGIVRTTFVINEKGVIEEIISKVETARHSEQLL